MVVFGGEGSLHCRTENLLQLLHLICFNAAKERYQQMFDEWLGQYDKVD